MHWIETRLVTKGNNLLNFDVASLASGVYSVKMGNDMEEIFRKLVIE
ncbi:MAG: T9SS type A sorting domain-containing protein [Saprospiraceae bacterium]|nr:T9SS type A sorting domain-containing protein [Saprospiraceae bacterium]MCF8251137.1 T9SS type A sorting domain-containing protein [Saprospiraceae bacterium]MCF8282951.1 T9SS type A sorting domain-containing protein [Bacteroidales bacterium]MCF8312905.1 T9SS type A sorting domain-containing protein [Saprospiraceae bacterium]MCF8441396.1 T9SS type A sorting domain-containing protein [Saprospiraceae bacterium]